MLVSVLVGLASAGLTRPASPAPRQGLRAIGLGLSSAGLLSTDGAALTGAAELVAQDSARPAARRFHSRRGQWRRGRRAGALGEQAIAHACRQQQHQQGQYAPDQVGLTAGERLTPPAQPQPGRRLPLAD